LIKYIKREGYRDVASSVCCIAGNKVTAPLPFARRPFNTKLFTTSHYRIPVLSMTSKVYVPCLLIILFLQTTLSTVLQKQTVVSFRSQAELNVANKKSRVVGRLLTKLTSAATENRQTLALDGTTTPFGKIQTATLHLIFVVVGGVMFLSIIVMAAFLVKRNMTPTRTDLPENEPLMNEEHGVSSSEHHRQAFLQASQILSETASTLEKEREKTFAAATAAKEFEQQNRALLRATGKERKQ
jgi:hypothetical protein